MSPAYLALLRPRLTFAVRRLRDDCSGQMAVLFALCSTMVFVAVGAGLDLSNAYLARQKLTQVAIMACQYASRPSIIDTSLSSYTGSGGGTAYVTSVKNFITTTLASQSFRLSQTNSSPFTYTQNGPANVQLSASVPTFFMPIIKVNTIPIATQIHCYDTPSSPPQIIANANTTYIIQESFEKIAVPAGLTYYLANGTAKSSISTPITPTSYTSAIGYTGANGTQWHIVGYCLEQDRAGQIRSDIFDGNYSVELDCENGSDSAGNSSITTQVYLAAGDYELRYAYASRIPYLNYGTAYLCGTTASDLSWANATDSNRHVTNALRTNQINVYLDLNTSGTPPTHTTLDGAEQLSGSNLIDMCVYGPSWVQRSVSITVTTAGYYWLSFAADGANDSYGGQLDDILLCPKICPGTVKDNFTTAWANNALLFEDNFESPTYSGSPYNTNGNVNNSTGSSSYWSESGWGWANAPTNQLPYWTSGCPQGNQCIELGWNTNSLVSRPFLLVPGYYEIGYDYISEEIFSSLSGVYCGATPSLANISALSAQSSTATNRVIGNSNGTLHNDTNTVGVFLSHAQLASTPNTGNSLGSTTSYTNTDGTITTTPTYAPNTISLTAYDSAQNNPLLDICGYAASKQSRSSIVFVQKPAYYWLTFSALGGSDAFGGMIDDVKITALASPYNGSTYSSSAVTIPVPWPQPGATISYAGFTIVADRLTP
jgi:Flp pilus assembly protein TadG